MANGLPSTGTSLKSLVKEWNELVNFSNWKGFVVWKIKELDESNNSRSSLQKLVKFSKEAINSDDFKKRLIQLLSSAQLLLQFK